MAVKFGEPFLQIIADEALRQTGLAFAPCCGEGGDMPNPPEGLEVENWSGWLVPPERADDARSHLPSDWNWLAAQDFSSVFVTWSLESDREIGIHFEVLTDEY